MNQEQKADLKILLQQGNSAGALAYIDLMDKKDNEPKSEIQQALQITKEHKDKLNQLKK